MSDYADTSRSGDRVTDASRLIGYALQPRLLPAPHEEYRALLSRYLTETEFEATVRSVATGLDLVILDSSLAVGLVVGSTQDSVFEWKVGDYAKRAGAGRNVRDRVMHGLIHVAIAATAFPRPADLTTDGSVQRVTAAGVDRFLRATIEKMLGDTGDRDPELEAIGAIYAKLPQAGKTTDDRRLSGASTSMIAKALEFLTDQGMLNYVNDEDGGTYRTTLRFQVQVRELAGGPLFSAIIALHDDAEVA